MCDTLVSREVHRGPTFFAKNSDRDPGEPQLIQYVEGNEGIDKPNYPEHRDSYDRIQYQRLLEAFRSLENPLKALISRPAWMWGAEMGVNEEGVAIGNEAVFARSRTERDGLLGMDVLRLALHNAHTASEGVDLIAGLIEQFGQGGNGSYSGTLRHHNSFMIADRDEAWILESAGRKWVSRRVETVASISNAYGIGTTFDRSDAETRAQNIDFARKHASGIHLLFTKGRFRQRRSFEMLEKLPSSWESMRSILLHNEGSIDSPDRSMRSICMDANGFIKSKTSASMIVEYQDRKPLVWLTGSPNPTYSPFIPFTIDEEAFKIAPHANMRFAYRFATERIALLKQIETAPVKARLLIAELARATEENYRAMVEDASIESLGSACVACLAEEQSFRTQAHAILVEFGAESVHLHEKPDSFYRCG